MGSAIERALRNGLRTLEQRQGRGTFVFRGQTIPCVLGDVADGVDPEIGGNEKRVAMTILVRVESFPEEYTVDMDSVTVDSDMLAADSWSGKPRYNHLLEANGYEMKVSQVRKSGDGSHWAIDLVEKL